MSTQMEKAIVTADRIVALAADALCGLDRTISGWPADFRAIIWDAVADIASRRAAAARK